MSLTSNIAANYASQLYTALIGIVLVPLYLQYMGSEAYGLVGFFTMLQAWFNLLDLGLTPTIARESAPLSRCGHVSLGLSPPLPIPEPSLRCIAVVGGALFAMPMRWPTIG